MTEPRDQRSSCSWQYKT